MGTDLKPCPFCGAAPLVMQQHLGRYACCSTARDDAELCSTTYHHEDDWNHRPVEDALQARLTVAEAALAAANARGGGAIPIHERHEAATACCVAEGIDAPPPPDQMIAGIQARHPGAVRWAGIIFGLQTGYERDWRHLYEVEVEDLREDYVAMHKRAAAAEAALAAAQAEHADALAAARAEGEAAGRAAERAAVVRFISMVADELPVPALAEVAEDVADGLHLRAVEGS